MQQSFKHIRSKARKLLYLNDASNDPVAMEMEETIDAYLRKSLNRYDLSSNVQVRRVLIRNSEPKFNKFVITARKRSFEKIMFLRLSVILFGGGGGVGLPAMQWGRQNPFYGQTPPQKADPLQYGQPAGSMHPTEMHTYIYVILHWRNLQTKFVSISCTF